MRRLTIIALILAPIFVGLWINVLPVHCEHCGGTTHHTNLTDVLFNGTSNVMHLSCAMELFSPPSDTELQLSTLPPCQIPQTEAFWTNRSGPMYEQRQFETVLGPCQLAPVQETAQIPAGRFSSAERPLDGTPKARVGEQESPS